jgi:carbon monoxide dehydrogenase subunit G
MAHAAPEIHIDRDPDAVWAVTGDFAGLDTWMPGITACELEGDDVRSVYMGEMLAAKEKLVERDDAKREIAYSIVDGAMPLDSHLGRITVVADGTGSKVTWAVDATPDEMAEMLGGIYAGALDALKAHLEQ